MKIYFKLFLVGLIPVGLTVLFYFLKKTEFFKRIPEKFQNIIIGLFFGIASILGTVLGVDVGGATANARDAAPLCAGLIFSGTSGIISGIMGGVYRYIAVYFSPSAGAYSQLACSISTILSGLFAATLRRFMFENKRPTVIFGFATGIVMEVFHMTVLFLTHLEDPTYSIEIVKICTIPMILCNSVSVALSIFLLDIFSKSYKKKDQKYKQISQQIQAWLLFVVVLAYLTTTSFVYILQTGTETNSAKDELISSLKEFKKQLDEYSEKDLNKVKLCNYVGKNGCIYIFNREYILNVSTDEHILDKNKSPEQLFGKSIFNNLAKEEDSYFSLEINDVDYFGRMEMCSGNYILAVIQQSEIFESRDNSVYVNSFMEVIVFAALFFIVYELIKRKVVNNIKTVNDDLSKIIGGDLSVMVDVKTSEEFFSLSNDINSTVETLKKYIDEAAKRIDAELAFAKNIQHSAIPSIFPAFPSIKDFDLYATMYTAKEVGGDFYDFYLLDKNKIALLIADVSGKGIPAAMFMMRAKTLIKTLAERRLPLNEVFNLANDNLCEGNDAGMFVTAWMGIVDYETGELEFVNAGHNPPMIISDNGTERIVSRAGFVLAGMKGVKYKSNKMNLRKGDKLFLYTDGVTEATTLTQELYSEKRLIEYLDNNKSLSCESLILGLKKQLDKFADGAEQFDDITMLSFDYCDKSNDNFRVFNVQKDDFSIVGDYLENKLIELNVENKAKNQILIAAEEIYVNICSYSYKDKIGEAIIQIINDDNNVTLRFIDSGTPFNPLEKENPDITLSAQDRKIGGLGIYMVKKMMDDVKYEFIDDKNVLSITKKIK